MSNKNPLTNRERRRFRWFALALLLGAGLSLAVVLNSAYQYHRFNEFQQRARSVGRNVPSAAPLQTNLLLNGAAALALFGCMTFLFVRMRVHLRARSWEQQLTLARSVQASLIPAGDHGGEQFRVAAEFAPAMEVGGDLYDVFETSDGKTAFAVGDVAGKGLPAALLMGLIHGALRSNAWYRGAEAQEEFAGHLNRLLCSRAGEARFASLFWGSYDADRGELRYVSAGHCPGFVVRSHDGAPDIARLDSSGPVLGLLNVPRYRQEAVPFYAGDLLVLYSDGLIEATNETGEEFGETRLCLALARCAGATAEEARAEILRELRAFLGNEQPDDDLTLLVLEARGVGAPEPEQAEMVAA